MKKLIILVIVLSPFISFAATSSVSILQQWVNYANALKTENDQLKAKIVMLENKIKTDRDLCLDSIQKAESGSLDKPKKINKSDDKCLQATKEKDDIEKKVKSIKATYTKKIETVRKNKSGSFGGVMEQEINKLEREMNSKLADLAILEIPIMSNYNSSCHGYYSNINPVYPTYTPPVRTYCTRTTSGMLSCSSYSN